VGLYTTTIRATDPQGRHAQADVRINILSPGGTSLTIHRASGPAGIRSNVGGITCPAFTGGAMWLISQGAGQTNYGGAIGPYAWPGISMTVGTANDVTPGNYTAYIACRHSPDGSQWDGTIVKTYEFTQTITAPTNHLQISPAVIPPGSTMTVRDGSGCGAYPTPAQTVTIEVFDAVLGGSPLKEVRRPVNANGRWGPVEIAMPTGDISRWSFYATCQATDGSQPDFSGYSYPQAAAPATTD
jgi:hypothetical protein